MLLDEKDPFDIYRALSHAPWKYNFYAICVANIYTMHTNMVTYNATAFNFPKDHQTQEFTSLRFVYVMLMQIACLLKVHVHIQ